MPKADRHAARRFDAVPKFFEQSLTELQPVATQEPATIILVSVPAPVVPVARVLRSFYESDRDLFCWYPPRQQALVGTGVAAEIRLFGPDRLKRLESEIPRLFDRLRQRPFPGLETPRPRIFGGLSFVHGNQGEVWRGLDEGLFVLPRWSYERTDDAAFVNLAWTAGWKDATTILAEFDRLWTALSQPRRRAEPSADEPSVTAATHVAHEPRIEHLEPKLWNEHVREIRSEILAGSYQKLVAARSSRVLSNRSFDIPSIFERLSERYPDCHRLLFRRDGVTFIGAPPETLFKKSGTEMLSHALAGSVRIHPDLSPSEAGQALLRSRKNRDEHEVVLQEILHLLEDLVDSVEFHKTPRVIRLQNLLHLESMIEARLKPGVSALDLLGALHPTPAVAGWPRAEAVRWILAHESPRGWYAAPVGWLDSQLDGEFAVAIRSALIRGNEARVFAGAGIMHDSDPPMEYVETGTKLQAMLNALAD